MCPIPYRVLLEMVKNPEELRKRMVDFAREQSIKAAARAFGCSINTVRRWLRRYEEDSVESLKDLPRTPKHCPHKTPPELEELVVELRKRTRYFGPRRLKMEFDLPVSIGAIQRILRHHGLTAKHKKPRRKKRNLRAIKATLPPLCRLQVDVKYLNDIPHYVPQMVALDLPRYQYTARCVPTGALFVGYGSQCTKLYATLAIEKVLGHLRAHGIETSQVVVQTDYGSEFDGTTRHPRPGGFHWTVVERYGAELRRIHHPNQNADVETLHGIIEREFFAVEDFSDRADFFAKAATYQLYFNLARPNSYKEWSTPLELLRKARPELPPEVLLLPPLDLDTLAKAHLQGDQHLPALPADRAGTWTTSPTTCPSPSAPHRGIMPTCALHAVPAVR